ncbi:MAG: hypothetical protein CSA65_00465 [Proteobacteria bacterium]|nr:MAG: hypothetical protein CSA65_00465 [Pseudomonadota bacterium]
MGDEARDTERWLAVGFCLGRLTRPSAESVALASPWVRAALEEAPQLPPVGVIADVGQLLAGAALDSSRALSSGDPAVDRALARYDEHVLGRLAADPRLEAAADALARLPERQRPAAVALVVEHLLGNLGFDGGAPVRPAIARRLLNRPPAELLDLGLSALRHQAGGAEGVAALVASYEELAQRARHLRMLLSDAIVFALENLEVLRSRAQRLAAGQMVEIAAAFDKAIPQRLRRIVRRRGDVQTRVEDDSHYPTGGFSAISNSGSLENLVSSELAYMDPAEEAGEGGEREANDLFDVRYAEGELLYYTRDESVFSRNRRLIVFSLAPDLVQARFKDAQLPAQRLVMALGLLLSAARRLSDWLRDEALELRVVLLDDERGVAPLSEEREVATLLLGEWIDKGVACVKRAESLDALRTQLEGEAARAEVDLVSFASSGPREGRVGWQKVLCNHLDLSASAPVLTPASGQASPLRDAADPWQAWVDAARQLLRQLL